MAPHLVISESNPSPFPNAKHGIFLSRDGRIWSQAEPAFSLSLAAISSPIINKIYNTLKPSAKQGQ